LAEEKPTLLIVEDDLDVAEMLEAYFITQGYQARVANDGESGVKAARSGHPDLVILDIRLPDFDGYEVARRLRTHHRTREIPIIFLTEKRSRSDRLQGLELGADDYITKPFDIHELRLRVRNALRRSSQASLTNPVTTLPEGVLVDERLRECLEGGEWALMRISVENVDRFREKYGFVTSDDVLRAISLMIHNAVREVGSPDDFVGHLSPSDFLLVTGPAVVRPMKERILTRITESLSYFYPLKDRDRGDFTENHLTISINELYSHQGPFANVETIKNLLQT
jgi:DNA-binding response OmpR family regulator